MRAALVSSAARAHMFGHHDQSGVACNSNMRACDLRVPVNEIIKSISDEIIKWFPALAATMRHQDINQSGVDDQSGVACNCSVIPHTGRIAGNHANNRPMAVIKTGC